MVAAVRFAVVVRGLLCGRTGLGRWGLAGQRRRGSSSLRRPLHGFADHAQASLFLAELALFTALSIAPKLRRSRVAPSHSSNAFARHRHAMPTSGIAKAPHCQCRRSLSIIRNHPLKQPTHSLEDMLHLNPPIAFIPPHRRPDGNSQEACINRPPTPSKRPPTRSSYLLTPYRSEMRG